MKAFDLQSDGAVHWLQELAALGATIQEHRVLHFGEPAAELRAARDGTVMCDLSHLGVIAATGSDSDAFLQGQLSSDVRQLNASRAQFSSYNTPKGRMLASFLVYRTPDAIFLQLPRELASSICKRLGMFILRSKVKLDDASEAFVRIGVAGPSAETLIGSAIAVAPASALEVAHGDSATVIRLPGDRFEIVAGPAQARHLWNLLSATARPAGAAVWDWLDIRAGIPAIVAATQDQFVPQMVNFDLVGGVSFQKGCYPGQEIVARTQYLGKLKRRMYLAHVGGFDSPAAGSGLYSRDLEDQASGMVVAAAPAPEGGFDLLAVIQMASADSEAIHLGALDGPVLAMQALPYAVS